MPPPSPAPAVPAVPPRSPPPAPPLRARRRPHPARRSRPAHVALTPAPLRPPAGGTDRPPARAAETLGRGGRAAGPQRRAWRGRQVRGREACGRGRGPASPWSAGAGPHPRGAHSPRGGHGGGRPAPADSGRGSEGPQGGSPSRAWPRAAPGAGASRMSAPRAWGGKGLGTPGPPPRARGAARPALIGSAQAPRLPASRCPGRAFPRDSSPRRRRPGSGSPPLRFPGGPGPRPQPGDAPPGQAPVCPGLPPALQAGQSRPGRLVYPPKSASRCV